jgi:DNA primase
LIKQETIQEIQNRIDIIDIVGNFMNLKRRGTNHIGNCPFHNEKSPSFTVSQSKEIYKCFGCGKSGNAITFVMEHEKYSYVEALRWLAKRYNIDIEEEALSTEQILEKQTSESLFILNSWAQNFFTNQLLETDEGKTIALSYLEERGFTKTTMDSFLLGYSPVQTTLVPKALESQFKEDTLTKSGLAAIRNNTLTDNYRGRIIFPIQNISGKIIGFGARIIGKIDNAPKYINTPENELYVKSKILYGLYIAKQYIGKEDECLLVEGYTDVISMHQAGVENVVASGGTSLTTEQLNLIKKFTKNLTIVYDGDNAGIKAALRGINLALEAGLYIKVVLLPDGEDPDSYATKYGGAQFRNFVNDNKQDVITFQLSIMLKEAGKDSQLKANAINTIAESISKINKAEDFSRQQDYVRQCASMLNIDEAGLHQLVNKHIREKINKVDKQQQKEYDNNLQNAAENPTDEEQQDNDILDLVNKVDVQEKALAKVLIEYGQKVWDDETSVAHYILKELEENELIEDEMILEIIAFYKSHVDTGAIPDSKTLTYTSNEKLRNNIIDLLEEKHQLSTNWEAKEKRIIQKPEDNYISEIQNNFSYLKIRKIKKMITTNEEELKDLEGEELMFSINVQLKLMEMLKEFTKPKDIRILK